MRSPSKSELTGSLRLLSEKFRLDWRYFFIFFTAVIVAYSFSLRSPFIWDDWGLIVENPLLAHPGAAFSSPLHTSYSAKAGVSFYYRPIQAFSYSLDFIFWKASAFGYHLTNIVIHFLNTCLVFRLWNKVSGRRDAALYAGLLFAVCPVFITSVTYISGRADLLLLLFILISCVNVLKFFETGRFSYYCISLLSFLFALFSKESACVFLVLVIALIESRTKDEKQTLGFRALVWSGFFFVALFYFVFRGQVVPFPGLTFTIQGGALDFFMTIFRLFSSYVLLGVFPINAYLGRSVVYGFDGSLGAYFSIVFVFLAVFWFLRQFRSGNRPAIFAGAWFVFSILPMCVYNILYGRIGNEIIMPDNQFYLASVGLLGLLSLWFIRFFSRRIKGMAVSVFVAVYVLILLFQTIRINLMWSDEERALKSFLSFNRKISYSNCLIFAALGGALKRGGRIPEAKDAYHKAISLCADAASFNNLANIYFDEKNYDEAKKLYEEAIRMDPDFIQPSIGLALIYFKTDRPERAEELIKKAEARDKNWRYVFNYLKNSL